MAIESITYMLYHTNFETNAPNDPIITICPEVIIYYCSESRITFLVTIATTNLL